jgi:Spy/CpxP family protein refolding chaperone
MRGRAFLLVSLLSGLLVTAPACDKKPSTAAPAGSASSSSSDFAADASVGGSETQSVRTIRPLKMPHVRGFVSAVFRALRETPLTDAQEPAVEAAIEELRASETDGKVEYSALLSDLVAGIRAGKLDASKIQADLFSVDKAAQAHREREAKASNALHAAMDASSRKALLTVVGTRITAREGARSDVESAEAAKRRVDHMTGDLGLTAAQKKQVAEVIAKGDPTADEVRALQDETRKRTDAFLRAFDQEDFDARKLELFAPTRSQHEAVDRDVRFLAVLLPILTPAQRDKLASIRENRGWGRVADGAEGGERWGDLGDGP